MVDSPLERHPESLSEEERAELDRFVEIERLMQLVKARARALSA